MITTTQILTLINALWLICGTVGGFFAFRHAVKTKVIELQHETIELLQAQIEALEHKTDSLKEENTRQALIIETIQSALKQKGMIVTIDGDLVTITDAQGGRSSVRKPRSAPLARGKKAGDAP
jgi:uncharacterized protein YlxW (UPF0749 family)